MPTDKNPQDKPVTPSNNQNPSSQPPLKDFVQSLLSSQSYDTMKDKLEGFTQVPGTFTGGQELSTYDEGRTVLHNVENLRAKNQPWYSELGSALGRTVGDVLIGQTLVGVGALGEIPDIIHSEVTGAPNDFSNWLIDLGNNVSEWSRENMPIYRENPGKSFDMSDTAWWMEGLPNAASTISMFLPAGAAMKGLSAIGKLKMVQGVLSKMNPMLLKGLGMITHAGLMRSMEGVMEANGAYKTIYDNTLSEISHDPETYINNFLQTEEGQDYLKEGFNPQDPETVAKYIAGKGAMRSYNLNMGNIVFDLAQLGAMYKSMSAIGSWGMLDNIGTSKKVLKTAGLWDKMSKTEKFLNYSTNNIIFNSLNEIPEEMWNTISTKEGEEYAKDLLAGREKTGMTFEKLGNYLKDGEVLESGFWGAFGGAMFGAGSKYLGKVHNKLTTGSWDTLDRDDIRVKEIVERKQFFDKITKEIKDISEGNVVEDSFGNTVADYSKLTEQEKKDAISARKSSLGIDLGARLASTGNAELFVEQMKQDPTAFVKQLVETGLVSEEEAQKETQYLMNEITEGANLYKKYSNNRAFNVVSDFTKQNILNNIMQVEAAKAKYKKIYEVNNERVASLVAEKPMSVKEQANKDQINSVRETAVRTLAAQQLEKGLEARIEQFTKEAQASNITPENKAVLENKIESLSKTLKEVKALKGTDLNPNARLEEVDNGYKTTYPETSVDEQGNEVTKEASLVIDDSYVDAVDSAQQAILSTAYTQVADKTINDSLSLSSVKKAEAELKKVQEALATMSKRAAKVQELVKANEEAAKSEKPVEEKKEEVKSKKRRNLTKESAEENPIEEEKEEESGKSGENIGTVLSKEEVEPVPVDQTDSEANSTFENTKFQNPITYKQVETEPRGKGGAPQTKFDSNGLPFLITELVGQNGYPNTVTFADWVTTEMFKLEEEFKKGNYGFVYEYLDISNIHGAKTTVEERPIKAVVVKFNPDGTYTKISHNGNEVFAWVRPATSLDILNLRKLIKERIENNTPYVEKITGYAPYHHISRARQGTNHNSIKDVMKVMTLVDKVGKEVTDLSGVVLQINGTSKNFLEGSKVDFIPVGSVFTLVKLPGIAKPVPMALETRGISKVEARSFAHSALILSKRAVSKSSLEIDHYDVATRSLSRKQVPILDALDQIIPCRYRKTSGKAFYGIKIELASTQSPNNKLIIGDGKSEIPVEIVIPANPSREEEEAFTEVVSKELLKLKYKVSLKGKGKGYNSKIVSIKTTDGYKLIQVEYPNEVAKYLMPVDVTIRGTQYTSPPIVTSRVDLRKPLVQPTLKTSPVEAESVKTAPTPQAQPTAPVSDKKAEKSVINIYWGSPESSTNTKVLSNLAPRKFTYQGKEYGSVEHAYQTLKSGSFDQVTYDKYVKAGGYGTKIRGKAVQQGFDNLQLMRDLVVESFKQNPEQAKLLLNYSDFTHTTNEVIDKAFLDGIRLAQKNAELAALYGADKTSVETPKNEKKGRKKHQADLKIASKPVTSPVSTSDVVERLERILPSGTPVHVIKGLLNIASSNAKAWGMVRDGALYISDQAEAGTEYHEAFHVIFNYAISKDLQSLLTKDFEKRFSKEELESKVAKKVKEGYTREKAIEELIADAFMDYMMSDGKVKLPEIQKNIFQKIWDFIKSIARAFTGKEGSDLNDLFKKIAEGEYASKKLHKESFKDTSYRRVESPTDSSVYLTEADTREVATAIARNFVSLFISDGSFEVPKLQKKVIKEILVEELEDLKDQLTRLIEDPSRNPVHKAKYKIVLDNIMHEDPNSEQDLIYAVEAILRERGIKFHLRSILKDLRKAEEEEAIQPLTYDEEGEEIPQEEDLTPSTKSASDLNIEDAFSVDRSKTASGIVKFFFAFTEDYEIVNGEYKVKKHPSTGLTVYKNPIDVWKDLNRALSNIDNSTDFFEKFLNDQDILKTYPYLVGLRKRIDLLLDENNDDLSAEKKILFRNSFWKSMQGYIAEFQVMKLGYTTTADKNAVYNEPVGEGAVADKQVREWAENLKSSPFVTQSDTGEIIIDSAAFTGYFKENNVEQWLNDLNELFEGIDIYGMSLDMSIPEIQSVLNNDLLYTKGDDGKNYLRHLYQMGIKVEQSQILSYLDNILNDPSSLQHYQSKEETGLETDPVKIALMRLVYGLRNNMSMIIREGMNLDDTDLKRDVQEGEDVEKEAKYYTADQFLSSRNDERGVRKATRFFAYIQARGNSKYHDLSHYNVERKLTFSKQLFSHQQLTFAQMSKAKLSINSEDRKVVRLFNSILGRRSRILQKNTATDLGLSSNVGIAIVEGISTEDIGTKNLGIKSADLSVVDKLSEICNGILSPYNKTLPHNIPGDSGTHYVFNNITDELLTSIPFFHDKEDNRFRILPKGDLTADDIFGNAVLTRSYDYFKGEYLRSVLINLAYTNNYSLEKREAALQWLERELDLPQGEIYNYIQSFKEDCKLSADEVKRGSSLSVYNYEPLEAYLKDLETVVLSEEDEAQIRLLLADYIEENLTKDIEYALEEGFLTNNGDDIIFSFPSAISPDGFLGDSSDLKRFVGAAINAHFSNIEQYCLTFGDLMWYKDPFKRFKSQYAYGGTVATDQKTADVVFSKFYEKSPNYSKEGREGVLAKKRVMSSVGSYKTVTTDEVVTAYKKMAAVVSKMVRESLSKREGISETYINNIVKSIEQKFDLKGIDSADAASFCTLEFYGDYHFRLAEWTDELDVAYNKAMGLIKEDGDIADILSDDQIINVFKPVGVGEAFSNPDLTSNLAFDLLNPRYFKKTSIFPVTPVLAKMMAERNDEFKDDTFQRMLDYMYDTGTDIITMSSGEKGAQVNKVSLFEVDSDNNISIVDNPTDGGYYGDMRDLRLQIETAKELKVKTLLGTQGAKIILANMFKDGSVSSHWAGKKVKVAGKEVTIEQAKSWYDTVRRELAAKGVAEIAKEYGLGITIDEETGEIDVKDTIVVDPDKFVKALKESMQDEYSQNIIDSVKVITVNGTKRVNLSSLLKKERVENMLHSLITKAAVKHKLTGSPAVQVPGMGFAKTRVYKTSDFEKEYGYSHSKKLSFYGVISKDGVQKVKAMQILLPFRFKELFKDAGFTEEDLKKVFTDSEALFNPDLKKALTLVGVRIPTQSLNSIESMEIAGFLPKEYGDIVVVPDQLPAKAGSDFDIDKLMMYFYSTNKKGKIQNINTNNITDSSKEALGNYIIDFYKAVLSNTATLPDMMSPNSTDLLDGSIQKIMSERGAVEEYKKRKKTPVETVPWLRTQLKTYKGATGGKDGVGIVALHITHHVLSQVAGLKLLSNKKLMLDLPSTSPEGRGAKGYVYSLGGYTDREGAVISEILSQVMNVNVDAGKDDSVIYFGNINEHTQNQFIIGLRMQVGYSYMLNLVSSPIIQELKKALDLRNSAAEYQERNGRKATIEETKKSVLQNFINKYAVNTEDAQRIADSFLDISEDGSINIKKEVPETERSSLTLNEMEVLSKSLKENNGKLTEDGIKTSLKALVAFEELSEIQGEMFNLMMSNNADTKGADKNSAAVSLQIRKFKEVYSPSKKKGKTVSFLNADRIMTDSPLGFFRNLSQVLVDILDKELFSTSDDFYRKVEEAVLNTLGDAKAKYLKAEDIQQIKTAFFNYIISKYGPPELSDRNTIKDILFTTWAGDKGSEGVITPAMRKTLQAARKVKENILASKKTKEEKQRYKEDRGNIFIPVAMGTPLYKALAEIKTKGYLDVDERTRISFKNVKEVYVKKGASSEMMKTITKTFGDVGKVLTEDASEDLDFLKEYVTGKKGNKATGSSDPNLNALYTSEQNVMFIKIPLDALNTINEIAKPSVPRILYNLWKVEKSKHPELFNIFNEATSVFGKASANGVFTVNLSTSVLLPDSMGVARETDASRISDIASEWERIMVENGDVVIPKEISGRDNYTVRDFLREIAAFSFISNGGKYKYDMFTDYLPTSLQDYLFTDPLVKYMEKGMNEKEIEEATKYIFKASSSNETLVPFTYKRKARFDKDTKKALPATTSLDKLGDVDYVYNANGDIVAFAMKKGMPVEFIKAPYVAIAMTIGNRYYKTRRKVNVLFERIQGTNAFKAVSKAETYNFFEGIYSDTEGSLIEYNNPEVDSKALSEIEGLARKYKVSSKKSISSRAISLTEERKLFKEKVDKLLADATKDSPELAEKLKKELKKIQRKGISFETILEKLEDFIKNCR